MVEVWFNYHGATGGPKEATLTVATNLTEESVSIPLKGHVAHTQVSVFPERHDFGHVPAGSANPPTKTFTITSKGSEPFAPRVPWIQQHDPPNPPVRLGDSFKVVASDCNQVISPGESCSATVAFSPKAGNSGSRTGWLVVGGGMIPTSATLSGKATEPRPVDPDPPEIDRPKITLRLRVDNRPRPGGKAALTVRVGNAGPAIAKPIEVTVRSAAGTFESLRRFRIPGLDQGGQITRRLGFKIRNAVRIKQAVRFTAVARIAGARLGKAKKTVRVR